MAAIVAGRGVDAEGETASTLLRKWRGQLEAVRKRVLIAVKDSAKKAEPPPPRPSASRIIEGMAQSAEAGSAQFVASILARRPKPLAPLPESPYLPSPHHNLSSWPHPGWKYRLIL